MSTAMLPRLLLHLYPRAWRERYGAEMTTLLTELDRPLQVIECLDLAHGALDAHLHPIPPAAGRRGPLLRGDGLPILALILIVAASGSSGDVEEERGVVDLRVRHGRLFQSDGVYAVDGRVVSFGPEWYLARTTAPADYDGDGLRVSVATELAGLLGKPVTLGVEDDGSETDIFTIDGQPYRDPRSGPPPWAGGPGPGDLKPEPGLRGSIPYGRSHPFA